MKHWMLIAVILFISLGCRTTKDRPEFGNPVQKVEPQPSEPVQDRDGNAMTNGSGSENFLTDGKLQPVFFEYDRFDIEEAQVPVLESNARAVKRLGLPHIRIEGHCDERGTEEYNLALGDRRARAAREYLISLGLEPAILQTLSYGESRPFEKGHEETAWSSNRRAQFVVE